MTKKYVFNLYLSGSMPMHNEEIVKNLKSILNDKFKDQYSLEIIVVIETPELAENANIVSTPTLVKHLPPPPSTVVGDFTDKEKSVLPAKLVA